MPTRRLLSFASATVSVAVLAGTAAVLSAPFHASTPVRLFSPGPSPFAAESPGDPSVPSAAAVLSSGASEVENAPTF
jgi:hypothetical protein